MPTRFLYFVVILAIFRPFALSAQQRVVGTVSPTQWIKATPKVPAPAMQMQLKRIQTPLLQQTGPSKAPAYTLTPVFLPRWSADNLPFFCKIEHQWGKKMLMPVKFRLGSVEYVDWLEGK